MIKPGSDVLFQEPACDTRRLRRSVVLELSEEGFSIRFVAEPFEFEVDQEVLMYFNGKREFMQQIGRIAAVSQPEADEEDASEGPVIDVVPIGDPISAESRETYRVSTINADLAADVGDESGVKVQDLSSTGFAVLASEEYALGQTVEVSIAHNDEQCHGRAAVQSVRDFGGGRIRYGMRAIEEDPHTGEFLQVLQRISLAVQREQLQRS